jgi:hypothetical protein
MNAEQFRIKFNEAKENNKDINTFCCNMEEFNDIMRFYALYNGGGEALNNYTTEEQKEMLSETLMEEFGLSLRIDDIKEGFCFANIILDEGEKLK